MLTWKELIGPLKQRPGFQRAMAYVNARREAGVEVYPPRAEVFNAFRLTTPEQLRVVILGQDPYHEPGQAMGLCFAVHRGVPPPPSLQNIFRELCAEYPGYRVPPHGDLSAWAERGVLLLNTVLTVERAHPLAHANAGWEEFTSEVIAILNRQFDGLVFMLWGSYAQRKGQFIDRRKHLVLQTSHPSPLSVYRGFDGCGHFSAANNYLTKHGEKPIEW